MANLIAGFFVVCFVVCLSIGLGIVLAFWRGFVIQHLWNWLIVPTFALRTLTMAQAFAFSFVVGVLVGAHKFSRRGKGKEDWTDMLGHLLSGLASLGVGWLVKTYWL